MARVPDDELELKLFSPKSGKREDAGLDEDFPSDSLFPDIEVDEEDESESMGRTLLRTVKILLLLGAAAALVYLYLHRRDYLDDMTLRRIFWILG